MRLSCGGMVWNVQAGTPAESRLYYDHRGNENNSNKSVGDVSGSANTGMAVESATLVAAYHLPRPNSGILGIGHNRIWVKADKMDNKFNMIKDHITLRRTCGNYRTVIPTREEWDKDWPNWLRKRQIWFTDGACDQQGTGTGICKYQSKTQWHISLGQDATPFQAEVAAILDL